MTLVAMLLSKHNELFLHPIILHLVRTKLWYCSIAHPLVVVLRKK